MGADSQTRPADADVPGPSTHVRASVAGFRQTVRSRVRLRRRAAVAGALVPLAASGVAVGVFGWSWWTGVAALLTALVIPVLRKVLLRPAPGRLSGWRLPLRSRRRRRAERSIAHGYANSALTEYEALLDRAGRAGNARLLRDAACAAAEAEQHQRCLDLARRGLTARWTSRRTRGQLHALVAIAAIQLRQRDTARAAARESLQLLRISAPDVPGTKKAEWLVRFPPVSQMVIMFAEWTGNLDAAAATGFATSKVAARRFRWLLASQLLTQTCVPQLVDQLVDEGGS